VKINAFLFTSHGVEGSNKTSVMLSAAEKFQSSNGQCLRFLRTLGTHASVKLSTLVSARARTLTWLEVTLLLAAAIQSFQAINCNNRAHPCASSKSSNFPPQVHTQNKRRCEQIAHSALFRSPGDDFPAGANALLSAAAARAFDNTKTNSAPAFRTSERIDAAKRRFRCLFLFAGNATHMHVIMIMQRSPSRKASAAALVINNIRAAALNTSGEEEV
jgi:hypothetical protein